MRKIAISFALFLAMLGAVPSANAFFDPVNYLGAIGPSDNWTMGWTETMPVGKKYPAPDREISGEISQNTILHTGITYRLRGTVYVSNNATLFIEPGVIIRCDPKSALIITRGAKLIAKGSAGSPIIFTSGTDNSELRTAGNWRGIKILGEAKVAGGTDKINEPSFRPDLVKFGGDNDADNSGIMEYVRIEFAGQLGTSSSVGLAGLGLYGVGSKTSIDHIQVTFSAGDSYHFVGGDIDAKRLYSFVCMDDDFDLSGGFRGRLQFCVALRHATRADVSGSYSIEAHNEPGKEDLQTHALCSNFTLLTSTDTESKNLRAAVVMHDGGTVSLFNSIISGYKAGLSVEGYASANQVQEGKVHFRNNLLVGMHDKPTLSKGGFDINSWFVEPSLGNVYRPKEDYLNVFENSLKVLYPDYTLKGQKFVTSDFKVLLELDPPVEPFFDKTTFTGGFDSHDWTIGWSQLDPINASYANGTITISSNIGSSTTWSGTYLLKGVIRVTGNAELAIKAGTVIRCEEGAALIIEPGSTIKAEGSVTNPIVFTSNKPAGERAAGDWIGLVILGKGPILQEGSTSPMISGYFKQLPAIGFGGKYREDYSGVLKYVRIEFAGGGSGAEDGAGLLLAGVSNMVMDYLQVSQSKSDGFSFVGGHSNAKHLFSYHNTDDDLSMNAGYFGNLQYGLLWREPKMAALNGANGIEARGCARTRGCVVKEVPTIEHFTIIGPNRSDVLHYNHNFKSAISLSNNTAIELHNSIIAAYPAGLTIESPDLHFYAASNILDMRDNLIAGCKKNFLVDKQDLSLKWFNYLDSKQNQVLGTDTDLKLGTSLIGEMKFLPERGSPALK